MVQLKLKVKTEMKNSLQTRAPLGLVVVALLAVAGSAHAAATPMDVTSITDAIAVALVAIATVGAAIMGVHVAVKAYKWVRAAMS